MSQNVAPPPPPLVPQQDVNASIISSLADAIGSATDSTRENSNETFLKSNIHSLKGAYRFPLHVNAAGQPTLKDNGTLVLSSLKALSPPVPVPDKFNWSSCTLFMGLAFGTTWPGNKLKIESFFSGSLTSDTHFGTAVRHICVLGSIVFGTYFSNIVILFLGDMDAYVLALVAARRETAHLTGQTAVVKACDSFKLSVQVKCLILEEFLRSVGANLPDVVSDANASMEENPDVCTFDDLMNAGISRGDTFRFSSPSIDSSKRHITNSLDGHMLISLSSPPRGLGAGGGGGGGKNDKGDQKAPRDRSLWKDDYDPAKHPKPDPRAVGLKHDDIPCFDVLTKRAGSKCYQQVLDEGPEVPCKQFKTAGGSCRLHAWPLSKGATNAAEQRDFAKKFEEFVTKWRK
jgi:hypothetical protein